jgi:hypothetical protein
MKKTSVTAVLALAAMVLASQPARGQTQIKPYIMILLDTSSSMLLNPCNSISNPSCTVWESKGDGSSDSFNPAWGNGYPGIDTLTWDTDSLPNDSRLYIAKTAITNVVNAYGDVVFGLMRYRATECILCYGDSTSEVVFPMYMDNLGSAAGGATWNMTPAMCAAWGCPPYQAGGHVLDLISYQGFYQRENPSDPNSRCTPLGVPGGDVLVNFYDGNQAAILEWIDNHEQFNPARTAILNHELRATGLTPLARAIQAAEAAIVPVRTADPLNMCRGYYLVIITDGEDTCELGAQRTAAPPAAVFSLFSAGIESYTIGFSFTSNTLDNMADYGDDGILNNSRDAFNASNADTLSAAFQSIIEDTVLVEVCDYIDNDCDCPGDTNGDTVVCGPGDTNVDEGFTLYCNVPGGHPARTLCDDPGETVCDGVDDNCNGSVDEGLLNACGTCGPTPAEVCDGLDNDCDGWIDEGNVCGGCTPQPEICDGLDNDCDGRIDEGITRSCGTDVGRCTVGTQQCVEGGAGTWTACTGIGPIAETCNNVDDDCNGVIDGMSEQCEMSPGVGETGECTWGYRICTAGSWGACQGGIGPIPEVCDNKDNDCDGTVDDGNPGGGAVCGTEEGECEEGTLVCTAGVLVCTGGVGPTAEVCDGYDNDCDGAVDDGNPGGGAACGPVALDGIGICRAGIETCVTDGYGAAHIECLGSVEPETETCNCLDDDCDRSVDEGLPTGTPCGVTDVGECSLGTLQCDALACDWACDGEVGPTEEVCDGLDNDCDGTADDGNPEGGGSCGTSTGECEPGVAWCSGSDTPPPCPPPSPLPDPPRVLCLCEKGPEDEVCDGLDNDCDGEIDEGLSLGDPCGPDVGECEPGQYMCVDGEVVCVGGRGPQTETCDCLDNDCDGEADEENPCGAPAICYHEAEGLCYCVEPCNPALEFPCLEPTQVCVYLDAYGDYYCVGDPCEGVTCGEDEICRDGDCVSICRGIECNEGLVCVVVDRRPVCVPANCYVDDPDYACEEGEICKDGECMPDPCWEVDCEEGEFCREGACHPVCGEEDVCEEGTRCYDGECVEDLCYGASCAAGQVCDEETGECIDDPCIGISCLPPLECIGGECLDPPCSFVDCPEGYQCVDDTCVSETTVPDEGTLEEVPDAPDGETDAEEDGGPGRWDIMGTGGGGCAGCRIAGGHEDEGTASTFLAFALLAAMAVLACRRREEG